MSYAPPRALWASRLGFILAAAGSAVGLGNIWKFPYIAGENGGGAFVLVYLVCIAVVGLPIMMAELMIGRHTRKDAVGAFIHLGGNALSGRRRAGSASPPLSSSAPTTRSSPAGPSIISIGHCWEVFPGNRPKISKGCSAASPPTARASCSGISFS